MRNSIQRPFVMIAMMILILLFFPKTAFAYLDPGSGSFIFQILLAGLLGILFAIKLYWSKIKNQVNKLFSVTTKSEEEGGEAADTEDHSELL
jgi:hypothetical protein